MALSFKQVNACSGMAKVLYGFLPGSGSRSWKGYVTFQTVAEEVGVGEYWPGGSKEPAIATLLEKTLEHKPRLFESLITSIVRAGIKYRTKGENPNPVSVEEIKELNGLILEAGFKIPYLWDQDFLNSLKVGASDRAAELVEQELSSEKIQQEQKSQKAKTLEELKNTFYQLAEQEDRQAAGLELEKVLNGLFELSGLAPREPFRIVGEQIDGSFELDNEIYLVEAKWEANPLSERPLLEFRGKVEGKSSITRGMFITLNGCTSPALDAITRGKQPNFFLVDGVDLVDVLQGGHSLNELLRAKVRYLAEEGKMFLSVKEMTD